MCIQINAHVLSANSLVFSLNDWSKQKGLKNAEMCDLLYLSIIYTHFILLGGGTWSCSEQIFCIVLKGHKNIHRKIFICDHIFSPRLFLLLSEWKPRMQCMCSLTKYNAYF